MKYDEQFLRKNVGKIIKSERKKRNLKQENLADKIGVEAKTLSKVETGKVFISASLLSKLANFFEISPVDFFKFDSIMECENNTDKINAITQMLRFLDSNTLDIIYKMIKSISQ